MANFPALRPAVRRYTMGVLPVTTETGFGGGNIRFLHGTTSSGHTLELGFSNLTQAEAELLREHYRGQQGGTLEFTLSDEAWFGHTASDDLVPFTTRWVYAAQLDETHKSGGYVDVSVQLISVI